MMDFVEALRIAAIVSMVMVYIKAVFIGSSFNIALYFKHGQKYMNWYNKTIINAKFEEE
jgi:hypothetical protein